MHIVYHAQHLGRRCGRERRRWREAFERYQDELQQLMDALDDALMNDR
jgi:hypothetical protein